MLLKLLVMFCALAVGIALPAAAQADEIFGGVHVHDVKTPLDEAGLESGIDLSLGYRADVIGRVWKFKLQPYVFGAVNSAGNTSYAAVGLSARFPLGKHVYFRPGIGIAIHNGSAGKFYRTDKVAFGSRVLAEPEVALGTDISKRVSVEASWVHMSHGQLFGGENPGIDNLGMRVNVRF